MEIIEHGKLPSEREYEAKCGNCGCRFRFKESEADRQSSPKNESFLVIKCPQNGCGFEFYHEA